LRVSWLVSWLRVSWLRVSWMSPKTVNGSVERCWGRAGSGGAVKAASKEVEAAGAVGIHGGFER
jgi:hypothetical protein